jgi:hypothetical protein
VWSTWSDAFVDRLRAAGFVVVASVAPDRAAYVRRPPLGRLLPAAALDAVRRATPAATTRPGGRLGRTLRPRGRNATSSGSTPTWFAI